VRIGEQIRQAREAKELNQNQLARLAGCSQPYIRNIEEGTQSPTAAKLHDIARVLGVVFTIADDVAP
jgi:transcriptional regulator with XRE-family HTH domain